MQGSQHSQRGQSRLSYFDSDSSNSSNEGEEKELSPKLKTTNRPATNHTKMENEHAPPIEMRRGATGTAPATGIELKSSLPFLRSHEINPNLFLNSIPIKFSTPSSNNSLFHGNKLISNMNNNNNNSHHQFKRIPNQKASKVNLQRFYEDENESDDFSMLMQSKRIMASDDTYETLLVKVPEKLSVQNVKSNDSLAMTTNTAHSSSSKTESTNSCNSSSSKQKRTAYFDHFASPDSNSISNSVSSSNEKSNLRFFNNTSNNNRIKNEHRRFGLNTSAGSSATPSDMPAASAASSFLQEEIEIEMPSSSSPASKTTTEPRQNSKEQNNEILLDSKLKDEEAKDQQKSIRQQGQQFQQNEDAMKAKKSSSIVEGLRKFNGFRVSNAAQNNSTFSKFCNLFEDMDEEEEDEDEQELESVQEKQNHSFQSSGFGFFAPARGAIQARGDDAVSFKLPRAPKKQGQASSSGTPSGFSIQNKQYERSKRSPLKEVIPKKKEKPDVIADLRSMNGFRVSSKAQTNKSFSKFCNLFEGLNDDNDREAEEEEVEEIDVLPVGSMGHVRADNGAMDIRARNSVVTDSDEAVKRFMSSTGSLSDEQGQGGFLGFSTANNSKKLKIDPKKLSMLYSSFLGEDEENGKNGNDNLEEKTDQNRGIEEDTRSYDAFFSKSTGFSMDNQNGNGFVGFTSASGNQKLKVDPKKLKELERLFDSSNQGGEHDEDDNRIHAYDRQEKQKIILEERKEQQLQVSLTSTNGFSNPFGSKKLKVPDNQFVSTRQFKKMNKQISGKEDHEEEGKDSNASSLSFIESLQKQKQLTTSTARTPLDSKFQFHTEHSNNDNDNGNNNEDDDDDNDPFSRMLRMVSRKPVVPVKRTHPLPFKQVRVADSSKSIPTINPKATPAPKSSTSKSTGGGGVKSAKLNGKSFSFKAKSSLTEDASSSFVFAIDSAHPTSSSSSLLKSGKSSLQKPYNKPQAINNQNSNPVSSDNDSNPMRDLSKYKKTSKNSSTIAKLAQCPTQIMEETSSTRIIGIPSEYSRNPMIQLKFGLHSIHLDATVTLIRFEELTRHPIQPKLNFHNYQTLSILSHCSSSSSRMDDLFQKMTHAQLSRDINACYQLVLPCPCSMKIQPASFASPFSLHSFSDPITCFCNLSMSPTTEHSHISLDDSSFIAGEVNLRLFYLKLKKSHKQVDEQWVRTQFRQIVWKLACYESNLREVPVNKRLTVTNIYNELEYRLFAEVFACKRSILKQIAEQDAVKSVTMVLVIANVVYNESLGQFLIELSDGWYSVFVVVYDQKFTNLQKQLLQQQSQSYNPYYASNKSLLLDLITKRKLCAGKKVFVTAMSAPPVKNLEKFIVPNQNLLYQKVQEVFYNNLSSAPPTAKLGIASNALQKYFPRALKSLRPFGGSEIPTIDVFVAKRYPLCYEASNGFQRKGFCTLKAGDESLNALPADSNKTLGFTLVVIDALSYYDPSFNFEHQPWAEVHIRYASIDQYETLKEGSRIRFYNLKISMRSQPSKAKYDLRTQRLITNMIGFETTKKTKIEEMSTFVRSRDEQAKMRAFAVPIVNSHRILLEDVQDSLACSTTHSMSNELISQHILSSKLEIDLALYVVKTAKGTYHGISSKQSIIHVIPTKEVLAAFEENSQQLNPNSSSCSSTTNNPSNPFSRIIATENNQEQPDHGISKEDEALYEKLMKKREANATSLQPTRPGLNSTNPIAVNRETTPAEQISNGTPAPSNPPQAPSTPQYQQQQISSSIDDGRIVMFSNVEIESIRTTSIGKRTATNSSVVETFSLNYTFNTQKRVLLDSNLNHLLNNSSNASSYAQRSKQAIQDLIESMKSNSPLFTDIVAHLRKETSE